MFEERLYVHCSRAEAIKFLKKYITNINGKVVEENTRHIVWNYRYKEKTISCKSEIIGLGKATEIITSVSNKGLKYKKAQIPITNLYKELGKAFEITLSDIKIDKQEPIQKERVKKSPIGLLVKWSFLIMVGLYLFFRYLPEITKSSSDFVAPNNIYTQKDKEEKVYDSIAESILDDPNSAFNINLENADWETRVKILRELEEGETYTYISHEPMRLKNKENKKIIYELHKYHIIPNVKFSANIRLEKEISKKELKNLALSIYKKYNLSSYERAFLVYYLPDMKFGTGGWATTHFNPNLEVRIFGNY